MQPEPQKWKILIGNSFPLGLIQRPVEVEPVPIHVLQKLIRQGAQVVSFWGHPSTVKAASHLLGVDLRPEVERPALTLSPDGLPQLQGETFCECWILTATYREGYRPPIGAEVAPEDIASWNLLLMRWKT